MKLRKPNLFIVGAHKSGTSALHHFLKQHPEIFMSEMKELRFFCKDHIKESDEFYRRNKRYFKHYNFYPCRTEKDYLNFFVDWNNEKIAGEASPIYLYSKVAALEIHKFNPDAKIITLIRNPVDWLFLAHSHALQAGIETVGDFKKALALEKERKNGERLDKYSILPQPSMLFYFEKAKFSEQIQRYFDAFDKKQIKIIIYDDFRKDNAGVYREILQFLGVDSSFVSKFEEVNPYKKARFLKLKILFKSSLFGKIFSAPEFLLPPKLSAAYLKVKRFIFRQIFVKEQPQGRMDPGFRKDLMKKFKPEVEKLSTILNRDLVTLWGYDDIN